jgi:hypothetical protein
MWLTFDPAIAATDDFPGKWEMNKLGDWVDATDVQNGACKGMHALSSPTVYGSSSAAVRVTSEARGGTMQVESFDASLVRWGHDATTNLTLSPFPTPLHGMPDMTHGASWLLWGNPWNTNYCYWWPFGGDEAHGPMGVMGDVRYRFTLAVP